MPTKLTPLAASYLKLERSDVIMHCGFRLNAAPASLEYSNYYVASPESFTLYSKWSKEVVQARDEFGTAVLTDSVPQPRAPLLRLSGCTERLLSAHLLSLLSVF